MDNTHLVPHISTPSVGMSARKTLLRSYAIMVLTPIDLSNPSLRCPLQLPFLPLALYVIQLI